MDSSIIVMTVLRLSFGIYVIDCVMIFVKLTLGFFRSIVTLCSLYLLGIIGSQENYIRNGIASEFVMKSMTNAVALAVLPFCSFLIVWQNRWHSQPTRKFLFHDFVGVVTFATTIVFLQTFDIEFGFIVSKLF